ncbi:MAG: hypothetical protein ACW96N_05860 [Candidatus Thorarchaeota archaeon]|jgi:hypothetical protein
MLRRKRKQEEVVPPNPIKVLLEFTEADEQYVNMMLRKSAMRTLARHKKIPAPQTFQPAINPELDSMLSAVEAKMGLINAPIVPIKNCRKCYFSSSFRIIGNNWYSLCTNVARASGLPRGRWVHCESNLPCWRRP